MIIDDTTIYKFLQILVQAGDIYQAGEHLGLSHTEVNQMTGNLELRCLILDIVMSRTALHKLHKRYENESEDGDSYNNKADG